MNVRLFVCASSALCSGRKSEKYQTRVAQFEGGSYINNNGSRYETTDSTTLDSMRLLFHQTLLIR
jgi:hypothetical protein